MIILTSMSWTIKISNDYRIISCLWKDIFPGPFLLSWHSKGDCFWWCSGNQLLLNMKEGVAKGLWSDFLRLVSFPLLSRNQNTFSLSYEISFIRVSSQISQETDLSHKNSEVNQDPIYLLFLYSSKWFQPVVQNVYSFRVVVVFFLFEWQCDIVVTCKIIFTHAMLP